MKTNLSSCCNAEVREDYSRDDKHWYYCSGCMKMAPNLGEITGTGKYLKCQNTFGNIAVVGYCDLASPELKQCPKCLTMKHFEGEVCIRCASPEVPEMYAYKEIDGKRVYRPMTMKDFLNKTEVASPEDNDMIIGTGELKNVTKAHRSSPEVIEKFDMRDVDSAIMDFQTHVREVTGGNDYSCVDSTDLKRAIICLLSAQEKDLIDRAWLYVCKAVEDEEANKEEFIKFINKDTK